MNLVEDDEVEVERPGNAEYDSLAVPEGDYVFKVLYGLPAMGGGPRSGDDQVQRRRDTTTSTRGWDGCPWYLC